MPCLAPKVKQVRYRVESLKSGHLRRIGQPHATQQFLEPRVAVQISKEGVRLYAKHPVGMPSISAIERSESIVYLAAVCMDRGNSVVVDWPDPVRQRMQRSIGLATSSHCPIYKREAAQFVVLVGFSVHDFERGGEIADVQVGETNGAIDSAELWMQLQQA